MWLHIFLLTVIRIFAPDLATAMGDRMVDIKLWIVSFIHCTIMKIIGSVYAVHFVVTSWWRFVWWPRFRFFVPVRRSVEPPILRRDLYGVHHYAEVNGIRLHYVEKGDPDKPVLILLHGMFDFWFSWRHQIEDFSKKYRVIALDLRGFGDSEKPSNRKHYTVELAADDIRKLMNHLGVERISLIGHDWGSVVGWQFLARYMDLVDRYVLMTAPSLDVIRFEMLNNWQYVRKSWYMFFYQIPLLPELSIMLNDYEYLDQTIGKHATPEELNAYKYVFSRRGSLRSAINYYRASAAYYEDGYPVTQGNSFGMYLMVEDDPLSSSVSGVYVKKLFPSVMIDLIPDVGHFLHQENPNVVNAHIKRILEAE